MASLVTAQVENGVTLVELGGDLDVGASTEVRRALVGAIVGGSSPPSLAVDLRQVRFIDSSGLGVLVGALKKTRERDGSMALICAESQGLRTLTRTGLSKVFAIFPSPEALFAGT